ncbi:MAG: DUF2802 domain-containing protein [Pseudomonadaceae bacterium]
MSARDLLWLAVLALLGYASVQFLRALRAPRRGPAETPASASSVGARDPRGEPEAADEDEGDFDYAPEIAPAAVGKDAAAQPADDAARAEMFALQLENSRLRQELQTQKDLVSIQQQEIARLVEDITSLQDEAERVRTQPTSSPEYSEASVLAAQGLNAEMIAVRCGITLAEAELVLSLARRGEAGA